MRQVAIVDCEVVDLFEYRLAKSIENSTPVIWEEEMTTWGTLSQNERMCCDRNSDGILEGGYPV